jgi:hypothetical protein
LARLKLRKSPRAAGHPQQSATGQASLDVIGNLRSTGHLRENVKLFQAFRQATH